MLHKLPSFVSPHAGRTALLASLLGAFAISAGLAHPAHPGGRPAAAIGYGKLAGGTITGRVVDAKGARC